MRLPLFPLGTVLFPGATLPLHVFEPRYRQLVHDLLAQPEPRRFGVVAIREGRETGVDGVRALHDVGCVAEISEVREQPDGRFALLTVGTWRFRTGPLDRSEPYLQSDVTALDEPAGAVDDLPAAVRVAFLDYVRVLARRDITDVPLPDEPTALSYAVAAAMPTELNERQSLLEATDTGQRLRRERDLLTRELALLRHLRAAPLHDAARLPHHLN